DVEGVNALLVDRAGRIERGAGDPLGRLVHLDDAAGLVRDDDPAWDKIEDRRELFADDRSAFALIDELGHVDAEREHAVDRAVLRAERLHDQIDIAPLDPTPAVPTRRALMLNVRLARFVDPLDLFVDPLALS